MMSDGRNTGNPKFDGFALSLDAKTDAEADKLFKRAVATAARWRMPMGKTFFALALRHGRRQVRRALDGAQGAVSAHRKLNGRRHDA